MREIIKKWFENPGNITPEEAAEIICEYCRLFGDRKVSGEDLQALFALNYRGIPINWEKLIKYICIKNGYEVEELWSAPDKNGQQHRMYRRLKE